MGAQQLNVINVLKCARDIADIGQKGGGSGEGGFGEGDRKEQDMAGELQGWNL